MKVLYGIEYKVCRVRFKNDFMLCIKLALELIPWKVVKGDNIYLIIYWLEGISFCAQTSM